MIGRDRSDREFRTTCWVCGTGYRPRYTAGACPVCGRPADRVPDAAVPRTLDPDTRITALVVGSLLVNLLVLGALAVLFLTA